MRDWLQMMWEEQYQLWQQARPVPGDRTREQRQILADTRRAMRGGGPLDTEESWRWLEAAPSDSKRSHFLAAVCRGQQVSKRLARIMLRAGVLERDPSLNRWFVEPAVKTLGAEQVCGTLLDYLRAGTDWEKARAASARYWVRGDEAFRGGLAATAFREAMLREFVANPDLDVRRRILPMLPLLAEDWQPDVQLLVERAIAIARAHPDEYIRPRVEAQLGAGGPYKAVPSSKAGC